MCNALTVESILINMPILVIETHDSVSVLCGQVSRQYALQR